MNVDSAARKSPVVGMPGPIRRTLRLGAVASALALLATLVPQLIPTAASALPGCGLSPNYYTNAQYPGTGYAFGVEGSITVSSVATPPANNFKDQHIYVSNNASGTDGLEVGWFIGEGATTFYTSPHLFATNFDGVGYSEQDGTAVATGANYWYATWWSGYYRYYRVDNTVNGSIVWNTGSPKSSNTNGPLASYGFAVAGGEMTDIPGEGPGSSVFTNLRYLNSSGSWPYWTSSAHLCADPNLTVSQTGSPYQVNTGGVLQ